MSQTSRTGQMNVHIAGDVTGQLAIGDHNLLIGNVSGGIVNIIQPDRKPKFSQKPAPMYVLPRAFPGFLDREAELGSVFEALRSGASVSIYAKTGLGKTSLLRRASYDAPVDIFPHGIVYFSGNGLAHEDLLQAIFDYFYECNISARPTGPQLHQFLQGVRALILLDDVSLTYDDVIVLLNTVPQCMFVLASTERCLWGEGRCVDLHGLPAPDALVLIERELGRPLQASECPEAETLCLLCGGNPLFLVQAASLVRSGKALAEIVRGLQTTDTGLARSMLTQLNQAQKTILGLLAAFKGHALPVRHLSALAQTASLEEQLKSLLDLHLVQAHSPTYSLTGSLAAQLGELSGMETLERQARQYFIGWLRENPPLPDVGDVLGVCLSLLEKAGQDGQWEDVIALGRGIEKALALYKRWQAWWQVLEWMLRAAQNLNDRAVQGWVLHQLGTRSLCLGDLPAARNALAQALTIRRALGDRPGIEVTSHNLGLLGPPPGPPQEPPRSGPKPAPDKPAPPLLKIMLTLTGLAGVALIAVLVWLFWPRSYAPPEPEYPVPVATTRAPVQPPPTEKPVTEPPPLQTELPQAEPPQPEPPACEPGVWYCENFDDNAAQDWELYPAWYIQKDGGNLVLGGSRHEWASLVNHEWNDYRVTFWLRLFEGTIHLNYRFLPDLGYGIVRYFVAFNETWMTLSKSENGGISRELASLDVWHAPGEWHLVEIAGWGGHIVVYVDGEELLNVIDDNYLPGGSIAFETLDNSRAQVDEIIVTEPGQEPRAFNPGLVNPGGLAGQTCGMLGGAQGVTVEDNTDRPGLDYWAGPAFDPDLGGLWACGNMCLEDSRCQAYTFRASDSQCWLKEGKPAPVPGNGLSSGIKTCIYPTVTP